MKVKVDEAAKRVELDADGPMDLVEYAMRLTREDGRACGNEAARLSNMNLARDAVLRENKFNGWATLPKMADALANPVPDVARNIEVADGIAVGCACALSRLPRRRVARRLEDGDEIDADRYLAHEPDMWEEVRREREERRIVRILVNVGAPCVWGDENFRWRASAVSAVARVMEDARVPCEIVGVALTDSMYDGKSHENFTRVVVKRADQPLDPAAVTYVLGSKQFYRCAVFGAWIMAGTDVGFRCRESLGRPTDIDEADVRPDEFLLSRRVGTREDAEGEVRRFTEWLSGACRVEAAE